MESGAAASAYLSIGPTEQKRSTREISGLLRMLGREEHSNYGQEHALAALNARAVAPEQAAAERLHRLEDLKIIRGCRGHLNECDFLVAPETPAQAGCRVLLTTGWTHSFASPG